MYSKTTNSFSKVKHISASRAIFRLQAAPVLEIIAKYNEAAHLFGMK